jgi:formylglycine-generating enzyme required for sulfatase activity
MIILTSCIKDQVSTIEDTTFDCTQKESIELANLQAGVCKGIKKTCTAKALSEPNYEQEIQDYEAQEVSCDEKDNDCDGQIDEGNVCPMTSCHQRLEICDGIDNDCDRYIDENACQTCVPSAEICDGKDNDCNGQIDDLTMRFISCGVGACKVEVPMICENGMDLSGCVPKDKQPELCIDQIDNDCDGITDEDGIALDTCPTGLEMVYVPNGSFTMGNDQGLENEKPAQQITVSKGFYISKNEVTLADYELCMMHGGCDENFIIGDENCSHLNPISRMNAFTYPVNCLTWEQVRRFARWIGGDLPSEAQWEYVVTNGELNTLYPWGNQDPTCSLLIYNQCTSNVEPICSKSYGNTYSNVCDMLGNLSEWVLDDYQPNYEMMFSNENPRCADLDCNLPDPAAFKVIRGGDWTSNPNGHSRGFRNADIADLFVGFRIVIQDD